MPPGETIPPSVHRKPKKISKKYTDSDDSSSNVALKSKKKSKENRRDSIASESECASTPQDPEAVYIPGRKRPLNLSTINTQDRAGRTLIFKYSSRGDVETTTSLLKAGAVLHIADYAGWTPLHEACLNGHAEIVELMLIHGADVNARGGDGDTPLHDAVGNGHVEVVQILLRYGASFDCTNENGQTPLEFAHEVYEIMANETSGSQKASQQDSALFIIRILKDWAKMTNKVVMRDDEGQTMLHHLCRKGAVDRISKLLWYGCDINAQDNAGLTALHDACLHGQTSTVEKLLAFGADFSIRSTEGQTCLHEAVVNGHVDCVKLLLSYGFKDATDYIPLIEKMTNSEHYTRIKNLLQKPIDEWKPFVHPEYHPRLHHCP